MKGRGPMGRDRVRASLHTFSWGRAYGMFYGANYTAFFGSQVQKPKLSQIKQQRESIGSCYYKCSG